MPYKSKLIEKIFYSEKNPRGAALQTLLYNATEKKIPDNRLDSKIPGPSGINALNIAERYGNAKLIVDAKPDDFKEALEGGLLPLAICHETGACQIVTNVGEKISGKVKKRYVEAINHRTGEIEEHPIEYFRWFNIMLTLKEKRKRSYKLE